MVSIILPVYKVEQYLDECVQSVLKQTYTDIEVIMVDDGSPDNCGRMCDAYAKSDPRVKVIHKNNEGLGLARNSGLEVATGEFVLFVDSDDWLELNAVEVLVNCMEHNHSDLVVFGFNKVRKSAGTSIRICKVDAEEVYDNKDTIISGILCPVLGPSSRKGEKAGREMCVWTNLYRKSIIDKYNLRFVSEREYLTEDLFFNISYFLKIQKAVMIPECLYNYRYNEVSLSNAFRPNKVQLLQKMTEQVLELIAAENIPETAGCRIERSYIKRLRYSMMQILASRQSGKDKKQQCKNAVMHPLSKKITEILLAYNLPIEETILIWLINKEQVTLVMMYLNIQRAWIHCRGWRN